MSPEPLQKQQQNRLKLQGMLWLITVHPASALGRTLSCTLIQEYQAFTLCLQSCLKQFPVHSRPHSKPTRRLLEVQNQISFPLRLLPSRRSTQHRTAMKRFQRDGGKRSLGNLVPCLDLSIIVIVEETAASLFHRHSTVRSALMAAATELA